MQKKNKNKTWNTTENETLENINTKKVESDEQLYVNIFENEISLTRFR